MRGGGDSEYGPECGDGGCGGDASRRGPGSRVVSQSGLPVTEGMEGGDQAVGGSLLAVADGGLVKLCRESYAGCG